MKQTNLITAIILLVIMAGCGGNEQSEDGIITVDVTKRYPQKELILQDIFDVEYIPLDDADEYVTSGSIQSIGKNIIAVRNVGIDMTGDIFLFDRKGQGLRKINRKGQGPGEYQIPGNIVLDEDNNEMFVVNLAGGGMLVYDLFGNFKRSFKKIGELIFTVVANFDRDHLIFYSGDRNIVNGNIEGTRNQFFIMNKKDGSIIKEIEIPFNEKKWALFIDTDNRPYTIYNRLLMPLPHSHWIIAEVSSDTIYSILPDYSLSPFIARTPSIQSMNPEVFLFPGVISDRYYFMQTVKKIYDVSTNEWPRTDLVYDRQEKALFEYVVYNDDYLSKKPVKLILDNRPVEFALNNEIPFCIRLEAYELVEAYRNGELKEGRLKEIVSTLDPESNPVIMLVKHRK